MTFSLPCDACHVPLSGSVVTVRALAYGIAPGMPTAHRMVPSERPSDYLFCPACAETLNLYIRHVAMNRGVPQSEAG